jgi:hypothetical protein
MIKVPKIKKGPMGYAMDYRAAMGRLVEVSQQWCAAFDAGDNGTLVELYDMFDEITNELGEAANALAKSIGTGDDS